MKQEPQQCRALVGCALTVFVLDLLASVNGACDNNFAFSQFSYNTINFLSHSWLDGNSHIRMAPSDRQINGTNPPLNNLGQGQALRREPVKLFDPVTKTIASFSTSFGFTMTTGRSRPLAGDGLAFLIIPKEEVVETIPGGEDVTGPDYEVMSSPEYNLLALQVKKLDSTSDLQLGPDNSTYSGSTASTTEDQFLSDGVMATAWIDYDAKQSHLEVRLSNLTTKPKEKIVDRKLDLQGVFLERMFVGFASPVWVRIHWWNFTSTCDPGQASNNKNSSSGTASTMTFFPFTLLNSDESDNPSEKEVIIILSSVAAGGLLLLILFIYALVKICRIMRSRKGMVLGSDYDIDLAPRIFAYKELSLATRGFDSSTLLGRGGFGSVYKGILPGGAAVAVKRIEPNNARSAERHFIAEVASIGRLRHRNLVQLLGWCHEKGELLLVYDFMPNGSLDRLLFWKQRDPFPWEGRYNIIQGVASALAYMHVGWEKQVVHRDVKASNVLLDHSYQPRLGDFGLARLVDHNRTLSVSVAGTYGYLAPEIAYTGKATDKSDVYSFGALTLEVACGRRPIEKKLPPDEVNLVDWVWGLHSRGELLNAVDSRLQRGTFDPQQVRIVLSIGLLCSHPDPTKRPNMVQVLQVMRGDIDCPHVPLTKPIPPAEEEDSRTERALAASSKISRVGDSSAASLLMNPDRSTDSSNGSASPLHYGRHSHVH